MNRADGGIALRLILWAVVLAVVVSAALFIFVRMQEPLALGPDASVRITGRAGGPSAVRLTPDGRIWVATFLRNEGNLPVTIEGLGDVEDTTSPYVPISLSLGDGESAAPDPLGATFTPIAIDPGEGVGVLVEFGANADLVCSGFGADPGETTALVALPIRATGYAVPFTQILHADPPFARVVEPSREQCREAIGQPLN